MIGMERYRRVSLGYGELAWVVRVQSVTWAANYGCPCDRWWLVLSCSPSYLSAKGWVTLTFDSSPIKETFAKLSVSEFSIVSVAFQSVGRLEKHVETPARRVFPAPQPRLSGCRAHSGALS